MVNTFSKMGQITKPDNAHSYIVGLQALFLKAHLLRESSSTSSAFILDEARIMMRRVADLQGLFPRTRTFFSVMRCHSHSAGGKTGGAPDYGACSKQHSISPFLQILQM